MPASILAAAALVAAQQATPTPTPSPRPVVTAPIVIQGMRTFNNDRNRAPRTTDEEWTVLNRQYWDFVDALEFVPQDFADMVELRFSQADANDDGRLSRAELVDSDRRRAREPVLIPFNNPEELRASAQDSAFYRTRMLNISARMIRNGDMDGDRQLNRFEALVAAVRLFKRMDEDGDMVVKGNELRFLKRRDAGQLLPGNP